MAPYRAFISYKQDTDEKLARAIESGLHNFAKPWYQIRSIRTFRDKSNLSANPALWSTIVQALTESEYLIVLASPGAASSSWVAREVDWWLANKSLETILLVLTEGTLPRWNPLGHDFDWTSVDNLPKPLRGRYAEEPRYIDLRWAREEGQLSTRHAQFRSAILDLVAPIQGRSKDDLDGEDVRQHKILIRLAWGASILLFVLTAIAVLTAFSAVRQRNIAVARQLAAQTQQHLGDRLDLALLLGVQANRWVKRVGLSDTVEARSSLLDALQYSRHLQRFLPGASDSVEKIAIEPTRGVIAVLTKDGTITTWDILNRKRTRNLQAKSDDACTDFLGYSPDGRLLLTATEGAVLALDPTSGSRVQKWAIGEGCPGGYSFPSPGELRISVGDEVIDFDVETGKERRRRSFAGANDLTLSPDGQYVASPTKKEVTLWAVTDPRPWVLWKGSTEVRVLAFSADGRKLASGGYDGVIRIWDVNSRQLLGELRGHVSTVFALAFSENSKELVSAGWDTTVKLWDLNNFSELDTPLLGHHSPVFSIALSRDGNTAVTGSSDGSVLLWDLTSQQPLSLPFADSPKHDDVIRAIVLSPDGTKIASAGGKSVFLWNIAERKAFGIALEGHTKNIMAIAFNPANGQLASCAQDGSVIVWDTYTQKPIRRLVGPEKYVNGIAFSPDGKLLAAAGAFGSVIIWDTLTFRSHFETTLEPLESVAFSRRGNLVAFVGQDEESGGLITILDTTNFGVVAQLRASKEPIKSAVFSSDGTQLFAGGNDSMIRIWDIRQRQVTGLLAGHTAPVFSVDLSPDGKELVTTGVDRTLILWDVASKRVIGTPMFAGMETVFSAEFSPDGRHVLAGGPTRVPVLWDIDPESWERRACAIANRPFSAAEKHDYVTSDWLHRLSLKQDVPICE